MKREEIIKDKELETVLKNLIPKLDSFCIQNDDCYLKKTSRLYSNVETLSDGVLHTLEFCDGHNVKYYAILADK